MYLVGIDGGATKTSCVIGDEKGRILSNGRGSGSNYQVYGEEYARTSIVNALNEAMKKINISIDDIGYAVLGLAGADLEEDYKVLNRLCGIIFGNVPFRVTNDCWIGLRAGNDENWGLVTVCGTGTNSAGRTRQGREFILRSLSYEMGNWGGGVDILRDALHHAFRSEEETGPKTLLESEIPAMFNLETMEDMVGVIRSEKHNEEKILELPKKVFELASRGDRVCQDMLIKLGHEMGCFASGVIKKLGMENEEFLVVLGGSVFKGNNPLLIDEYTTVHRTAPRAKIQVSSKEPVEGAYLLAVDYINGLPS
jgi:N-acetylglucosamine kinase-like BadF-type ATPase